MNKNTDVEFSIAKQSRSEKTLDDLLDAADHLVTAADPKAFTARSLSEKSGYALGTLVNRLQSVENVFLLVTLICINSAQTSITKQLWHSSL